MTKSRTLRKAGAVALSLAMALSIAGTTPAQAASKVKLSSKKGTITVGKTKKVTIKNTKKSNIKKVTFKYSNTKKRVSATRSGLTLKFKGKKAGTVTITSKITLKKAVAGKKTYSLKYKATVKKATPSPTATPGELKLDKVEAAVRNEDQGVNVLVAYFTADVGKIEPGNIEIRDKAGNLWTAEKVDMADGNKKATITLTGSSTAGTKAAFLDYNVDYTMTVKTASGKALAKDFYIPIAVDGETVVGVDSSKKQITVRRLDKGGAQLILNMAADSTLDYQDILGKTFTIEYDKTATITKITEQNDTVVFGAFKTGKDNSLTDLATNTKYSLRKLAGVQRPTQLIQRDAKGATTNPADVEFTVDGTYFAWAKLTVTSGNVVKFIQVEPSWTGFIKVASVSNNTIINGKTQKNIKDFVIIKDGKAIKDTDLVAGDVVAYNDAHSFAEVIPSANTTTGPLTAVHDGSITYNGKDYKIKGTDANIEFDTKYSKKDAAEGKADNAYLDSLFAAKKDVTVTLNRAGQVIYLEGDQAAATTSTKTLVLTDVAKAYKQSLVNYIRFKGFNGTAVETIDVDFANVNTIVGSKGTKYQSGVNGVSGFDITIGGTDGADTTIATKGVVADVFDDNTVVDGKLGEQILAKELVILTLNDKNVVTGIEFRDAITGGTGTFYKNSVGVAFTNGTDTTFKAGITTANGKVLTTSTPVYIYDDKAATATATLTTLGTVAGQTDKNVAAADTGVFVYSQDGKNVSNIVVLKSAFGAETDLDDKEGIISSISYSTGKKVDGFSILVGTETITATEFAEIGDTYNVGDIVTASFKKGTTRLEKIGAAGEATGAATKGIMAIVDAQTNAFILDNADGTVYKLAESDKVTPTIAKIQDGKAVTATLAEVISAAAGAKVKISTVKGETSSPYSVDAIIVSTAAADKLDTAALATQAENLITAADAVAGSPAAGDWNKWLADVTATDKAIAAYVASGNGLAASDLTNYTTYAANKGKFTADKLAEAKKAVKDLASTAFDNSTDGNAAAAAVAAVVSADFVDGGAKILATVTNNDKKATVKFTFIDGEIITKDVNVTNGLDSSKAAADADATLADTWTKKA